VRNCVLGRESIDLGLGMAGEFGFCSGLVMGLDLLALMSYD
jgi:hypothetical protein